MPEPRPSDAELGRALAALGLDLAYPPTPSLAPSVTSRLVERAARARPPFAGLALWSRRRWLVVVAVGVLALLALGAAARFVLGAAEIRVQPGVTPSGPARPIDPAGIGVPVPLGDVESEVGFEVRLPAGPAPDQAYVLLGLADGGGAILAWEASERFPEILGTPWGLVLIEVADELDLLLKTTQAVEDVVVVSVDGRRAFWLDAPHVLDVITQHGSERFTVEGGVLIWTKGGITYRLETSLELAVAVEIAESIP